MKAKVETTNGYVKFWNEERGFGFIVKDGSKQDYFVHHSDILGKGFKKLEQGQQVQFVPVVGDKGNKATQVTTGGE